MRFNGTYTGKLDTKGRVSVPQRVRDYLNDAKGGQPFMIMRHYSDTCLWLMPESAWSELVDGIFKHSDVNPVARHMQRAFGPAAECEIDGNGRMLVPSALRDYAQLDKDVIFLGLMNKFEIWSKERYEAEEGVTSKQIEESEFARILG